MDFWGASIWDIVRAIKGYRAAHGIKEDSGDDEGFSEEQARRLQAIIDREKEKERS